MRNEVVEELTPDFVGASGLISASARQKPSLNREKSQRNEQQGRGEAGKPGKEATRCHSEQRACPRRGNAEAPKRHLRRRQAEPGSKACWETEQTDRHSASRWGSGIARPPLGKRETVMCPLSTREDGRRWCWLRLGLLKRHVHPLVAQELHAGTPMRSTTPITPEQRSGANRERMRGAG